MSKQLKDLFNVCEVLLMLKKFFLKRHPNYLLFLLSLKRLTLIHTELVLTKYWRSPLEKWSFVQGTRFNKTRPPRCNSVGYPNTFKILQDFRVQTGWLYDKVCPALGGGGTCTTPITFLYPSDAGGKSNNFYVWVKVRPRIFCEYVIGQS